MTSQWQSRVPEKKWLQKKCSVDLGGVQELRGPGYNAEAAVPLNNDVNK